MGAAAASYASMGAGMAQSTVSGIAGYNNAKAQAKAYKSQAKVARRNADIASQQAAQKEDMQRRSARQIIARQRAGHAESGVDPGSGTALDVLEQSQVEAELDALTIRYDGELQRQSRMLESEFLENRAKALEKAAKPIFGSGILGAAARALLLPSVSGDISQRKIAAAQGGGQQSPNYGGYPSMTAGYSTYRESGVSSRRNIGTSKPGGIGGF